jgi:hypothetical protein
MAAKLKYKDSDGMLLAWGHMPGLTAGAGETVVDYNPANVSDIQPLGHHKVDLGALPTISIIDRSAGEISDYDNANTPATGADIQTQYDTKVAIADQVEFLKDLAKLVADNTASKTNVAAL